MPKPVVDFEVNAPVEVALHWPDGKIVSSRFGERVMYSLDQPAGHVMFLDLAVAQQINMLEPGMDPFVLCKRGKSRFDVWKPEAPRPQSNLEAQLMASRNLAAMRREPAPAFTPIAMREAGPAVPAPGPVAVAPTSKVTPPSNHNWNNHNTPPANGNGASAPPFASEQPSQIHLGWAQFLLSQTNALTDVYAAALAYASSKHGNQVKAETVQSLLVTAFINQCKRGGPDVA